MVSVLVAAIAWLAFRTRKKGEPPITSRANSTRLMLFSMNGT